MAKEESAGPLLKNKSASSSEQSDSIRLRAETGAGDEAAAGGERLAHAEGLPLPA